MRLRHLSLLLAVVVVAFVPACDGDDNGIAVITIRGEPVLLIGTSSQYTATTTNGADATYTWSTSNPIVGTVDGTGMVTARVDGPLVITAVGNTTGATGTLTIACSADPDESTPNYQEWVNSPHNDKTAGAFTHWDEDGAVSNRCAKCHSTPGFLDFLGEDGTAAGTVENDAPLGTTVECIACHNESTLLLDSVTFPSGVMVPNTVADEPLGREAVCMQCHQGRESSDSVDDKIAEAVGNPGPDDILVTPDPDNPGQTENVGFINIHYFPAAATRYGGLVRGGYLYDYIDENNNGMQDSDEEDIEYDVLFRHVPGREACQDCHNPHSLEIRINVCQECHPGVVTHDDLHDIRMFSSVRRDYDGDGDMSEGLWHEINGDGPNNLRALLLAAIYAYGDNILGFPIVYDPDAYPYWFNDLNNNGVVDPGENIGFGPSGNRYTTFSARLLKATFNYQYATKDPGGFAHNGKFIIQLLHDSIRDLNVPLSVVVGQGQAIDISNADRNDLGHFDGTAEAFRHWDAGKPRQNGTVSSSCAKCHSASNGFEEFLIYGANTVQPIANGFDCAVCHTSFTPDSFDLRRIEQVTFPSGLTTPEVEDSQPTTDPGVASNICMTCHQGRVSAKDIDEAIAESLLPGADPLGFQNVHYLAAAATLFGSDANVAYEYPGKDYNGRFAHDPTAANNNCTNCHNPLNTEHTFLPQDNLVYCLGCHDTLDTPNVRLSGQVDNVLDIRTDATDWDGDGSGTERLEDEVETISTALFAAMQAYSTGTPVGSEGQARNQDPLFYDSHAYPYFFKDPVGRSRNDRYGDWDGRLLRAAHNYQQSLKEHGAWAHNLPYILQCLIDSIEDLGGDVSNFTRPTPP